ncbi:hypothetical protein EUX98_g6866 [Antrodiella citrinella]|uniref:Uncharacterized protein n=1 Tax=Antrodiella citrinella TaxID=2447956 RepID=A0A4V3XHZ7_9APHY|nr:hypothetical protein EUX98_g6866 [Antrodiella citrinella]
MPTEIYYPAMSDIPTPTLCQSCYSRSTHGGARYCKTCTAAAPSQSRPVPPIAAGNLCKYCHKKPQYGKYEYCGKTCAERAKQPHHSKPSSQSLPPLRIRVPAAAEPKKHHFGPLGDLITTVAKAAHIPQYGHEDNEEEADYDGPSPVLCMLPKCKQPVHVSKDGRTGEYCSQSHRE